MNEIETLSLDIGFFESKSVYKGRQEGIKSIVGEGRKLNLDAFSLGKSNYSKITCEENNKLYFVGDLALKESETLFHSLASDRFDTQPVRVLAKSLIATSMKNNCEPVFIVTGLPIDQYAEMNKSIKSMIENITTYEVTVDNITYSKPCMVDGVVVVPQPFGAFANILLDDKGKILNKRLASSTVAVIDIGFGTTDVLVCDCLDVVERLSFSTETAINRVYKSLQQTVKEYSGKEEIMYKMESVISSRKFRYGSKNYDMSDYIDSYLKSTSESLYNIITNKWGSAINDIDIIILAGGGSVLLSKYMIKCLSKQNIDVTTDSSGKFGIARGYWKWGAFLNG